MEPQLGADSTYLGWSNQMAPILAGLIRLTHPPIGSRHQIDSHGMGYLAYLSY